MVRRSITESSAWTFTLKRTGPSGDAPTLGTYAWLPLMTMLLSWFGNAPVANVKAGGLAAATWFSTEPFELNPVFASGWSTTSPITRSFLTEITVTCASL